MTFFFPSLQPLTGNFDMNNRVHWWYKFDYNFDGDSPFYT